MTKALFLTIFTIVGLSMLFLINRCGELTQTDPFESAYNEYLKDCAECHSPGTSTYDDVRNLDMSTLSQAKTTLLLAANLPGKLDCNGLRYVVPESTSGSMLTALFNDTVRTSYTSTTGCNPTDLSLMSMDPPSQSVLMDINEWINSGAQ